MMDNQKAIEYFYRQIELGRIKNDTEQEVYELAIDALGKQLKDKWIPVSERLPTQEEYNQNDGRFIVNDGNRRYQSLFDIYEKEFFIDIIYKGNCNFEQIVDDKVIAWKPMPDPYVGE